MTTDKSVPPAITPQQSIPRPEGPKEHGLTPATPPPPPPDTSDEEQPDDETRVRTAKDESPDDETKERMSKRGASPRTGRGGPLSKKSDRATKVPKPPVTKPAPTSARSGGAVKEDDAPTAVLDEAQRASGASTIAVNGSAAAWGSTKAGTPATASTATSAKPAPSPVATATAAAPTVTMPAPEPDPTPAPQAAPKASAESVSYKGAGVSGQATLAEPAAEAGVPREIRLSVARIDPWSVLKLALILSFAVAIVIIVATAMFWYTLDGLQVFQKINDFVKQIVGPDSKVNVLQFVAFSKVMSVSVVIAVVNIVLTTALATIGSMIYNAVSRLVGGLHLTLMDD